MWKAWDEAQAERQENNYPALKGELPDISEYDLILIGGASWGYTLANPVLSFVRNMDFNGKKYRHSGHSTITMKSGTRTARLKLKRKAVLISTVCRFPEV